MLFKILRELVRRRSTAFHMLVLLRVPSRHMLVELLGIFIRLLFAAEIKEEYGRKATEGETNFHEEM